MKRFLAKGKKKNKKIKKGKKERGETGMDFECAKNIVSGFSSCDMVPLGNTLPFHFHVFIAQPCRNNISLFKN